MVQAAKQVIDNLFEDDSIQSTSIPIKAALPIGASAPVYAAGLPLPNKLFDVKKPAVPVQDLFSAHDFDINIDLDVSSVGTTRYIYRCFLK